MCSFCGRPRTLRNEQHQLGTLVRTIVTCETCHRTLSSSIGVAEPEAPVEVPARVAEVKEAPEAASTPAKRTAAKSKGEAATPKTPEAKPKSAAAKAKAPANRSRPTK